MPFGGVEVAKKTSLWDCIVLQLFQSMLALVGPSVKNAVKIGVSRGVVSLFGCVCAFCWKRVARKFGNFFFGQKKGLSKTFTGRRAF